MWGVGGVTVEVSRHGSLCHKHSLTKVMHFTTKGMKTVQSLVMWVGPACQCVCVCVSAVMYWYADYSLLR